jgi:uncharacterized protein YecE (DUF72 family)
MKGQIRVGIGGWSYEPWRGTFYPPGLPATRELEYASRAVQTIEINGTFYSTFKPETWRKWRDATPDDFIFAIKASRLCTVRRELATAGSAIRTFLGQGITELGAKLGPINWQLDEAKEFEPDDVRAFLKLLTDETNGVQLRHSIEAQHSSFDTPVFFELLAERGIPATVSDAGYIGSFPPERDFTYARIKSSAEDHDIGFSLERLHSIAQQAREWSYAGDVFLYFIDGAKAKNPAAAQALIAEVAMIAESPSTVLPRPNPPGR